MVDKEKEKKIKKAEKDPVLETRVVKKKKKKKRRKEEKEEGEKVAEMGKNEKNRPKKKLLSTDEKEARISLAVSMWAGDSQPSVKARRLSSFPTAKTDPVFPGAVVFTEDDISPEKRSQLRGQQKIAQAVESWAGGGAVPSPNAGRKRRLSIRLRRSNTTI